MAKQRNDSKDGAESRKREPESMLDTEVTWGNKLNTVVVIRVDHEVTQVSKLIRALVGRH